MPETTLAVKAGIDPYSANFVGEVMEAVRVLINRGYIEIAGHDGVARLLKPTCEGTNCVHWQMKWFHKAAYFIREVWVAAIEGITKGLTKP